MMSKPRIYHAGPIAGLSYDEARFGWRQEFRALLENICYQRYAQKNAIDCFGPMRGKDHLKDVESIPSRHGAHHEEISAPHAILHRDTNDVSKSDLVILYARYPDAPSLGTVFEAGLCHAFRIPYILIYETKPNHWSQHTMLFEAAAYRVQTVHEAAEIAAILLLPGL